MENKVSRNARRGRRGAGQRSVPAAKTKVIANRAPIVRESNGSRRIRHREPVSDISGIGIGTPNVLEFSVNPGISGTFPWLATQASGYEMYKFHSLVFEYVTRTSSFTAGTVVLAPDYDPSDRAPTTTIQASTYQDSIEGVPWTNMDCRLDPKAMHGVNNRKYVRDSPERNLKMFDVANQYVVITAPNEVIGRLFVTYDVEFFIPQVSVTSHVGDSMGVELYNTTDVIVAYGNQVAPFDHISENRLGVTLDPATNIITVPPGVYLIITDLAMTSSSVSDDLLFETQLDNDGFPFGARAIQSCFTNATATHLPAVSNHLSNVAYFSEQAHLTARSVLTGPLIPIGNPRFPSRAAAMVIVLIS